MPKRMPLFAIYLALVTATDNPTTGPTNSPTLSPTSAPSLAPTTTGPTSAPSHLPTHIPTLSPSHSPTQSPSSRSPTRSPSHIPTTLSPSTSSPSFAPTHAPTTANFTTLPSGKFQTDCLPLGKTIYFQRSTMEITPPLSPGGSNGFIYTDELFLVAGCGSFDARIVITARKIEATSVTSTEANLDVFVSGVNATIGNPVLISVFANCNGGGWVLGVPRALNTSCVVLGIALPAPSDCPVFYSKIRFNASSIKRADLFSVANNTIQCSANKRYTNISSANFELGGYKAPPTCEPISNSSICAPFIGYPVAVPRCSSNCSSSQCQKLTLEKDIYVSVLPQIWSVLSSASCRASIARLLCATAYPRCTSKLPLCIEACDLSSACSANEIVTFNRLLSLLSTNSSQLCSAGECAPVGALPPPIASLENVLQQSALTPTPKVAYPTCANYDGKVCAGLVTYPVYIPEKSSLYELEKLFESRIWFTFGLAPRGDCFKAFTEMSCATIFNRCDLTAVDTVLGPGVSVPVPLPRLPCRSLCEAYNQSCAAFVKLAPQVLARDCLARDDSAVACEANATGKFITAPTGREHYPANVTVLESSIGLKTTCNELSVPNGLEAQFQCPYPLEVPQSPTSNTVNKGHCAIPCDAKFKHPWASPEWNQFFSALIIISFLGSVWTVVTFVVFRERLLRTQTQIYAFHTISCVCLATCVPIPVVLADPTSAVTFGTCIDNTREMTIAHPYCAATGILMTFFTVTGMLFFTAFVFDLWLVVSMRSQRLTQDTRDRMARWTFISLYGFALGFVIMAASLGKIKQSNLPYCFVTDWPSDMFWIVICGSLIVDTVLFFFVCLHVIRSHRRTTVANPNPKENNRSVASQYRRPIAFTFVCVCLFCIAAASRLQARMKNDEWKAIAEDWFQCTVIRSHISDETCPQYPGGVSKGFLLLTIIVIFTQGLIISSIFGFSTQNFTLWKDFFRGTVFPKISCLAKYSTKSQGSQSDSFRDSSTRSQSNAGNSSSNRSMRGLSTRQPSSVQMETVLPVDEPDTPSPRAPKSPRSPRSQVRKAPKPLSRALFVSSKAEFVPFD